MPETKRKHTLSFTPTVWAALEAEAARQHRSVNNLLETLAIAATSTPGETK